MYENYIDPDDDGNYPIKIGGKNYIVIGGKFTVFEYENIF
jgi:hypothetical protein